MRAIILAAGAGNRLRPLTDEIPKCMVILGERSLLDWQIKTMKGCGIDDIVVIKGYRAEKITHKGLRYYTNEDYLNTNMVATLWCARSELEGDVIVSYGDIVYNPEVLKTLMSSDDGISVVVDIDWEKYWRMRFRDPLDDAEALQMDSCGKIKVIGQKAEKMSDVEAGYIGLMRFQGEGIEILKRSFLNAKDMSKVSGRSWGISKPFEKVYMTDMLQGLINEGHDICATKISGGWLEVDSIDDYRLAGKMFANGRVSKIDEVMTQL